MAHFLTSDDKYRDLIYDDDHRSYLVAASPAGYRFARTEAKRPRAGARRAVGRVNGYLKRMVEAIASARSHAFSLRCCEPTWNEMPQGSRPRRLARSSTSTAISGSQPNLRDSGHSAPAQAQSMRQNTFAPGAARVILPITDPYVAHHGALGSFATLYLPPGADRAAIVAALAAQPGVEAAMEREEACARGRQFAATMRITVYG